jgi:hypothetical protein
LVIFTLNSTFPILILVIRLDVRMIKMENVSPLILPW